MKDRRRGVSDAGLFAGVFDQLGEHQFGTGGHRRLGNTLAQHRLILFRQDRKNVVVVDPAVPDVEQIHSGKVAHFAAIAARARNCRIAAVHISEPVGTGG
jgi:hypothetical protein